MKASDVRCISVLGTGLMGPGIAQDFAMRGFQVYLYGRSQERLQQALEKIRTGLALLERHGQLNTRQIDEALVRIRTSTELEDVAADADLVVEAVFENLALKQELFRNLDRLCAPRTILASTTSSLLPSQLATATERPDRVLVAHYFNPPALVPLVEVVRGPATSDDTVNTVRDLLMQAGKRPAVVQTEVPGFIGNRLQARARSHAAEPRPCGGSNELTRGIDHRDRNCRTSRGRFCQASVDHPLRGTR
jgi:3-hydroxybutyryl-CoA dehydrogenase